jgi:TldD protein
MVTVDDIPDMVGGMASYRIDDDGIEVLGPTPVVREGMLVGMLHSWESAIAAQTLPSANSRSASAWASPIPRMSNLCCYPGTTTIDALIAQISDGLYIHHLAEGFGIGDVIEARVVLAERVANGQLTNQFLTGGVVRERAGLLQRVIGLGDSISANPNAMCGKAGQLLADVGTWAPAMALSELRIDS